ncbi:MATE family efflux transporter [Neiella marina]|uniref:MATE family efflux transporter n=1 Tax=Neiella holothuriorum TaxID=2870530 RepID=A0ABS7EIG8_9GAMM|nr:MATE family efflux transporter [Neiella holothuriorum]MBW8191546.1 MATE family efflux transporter [Neiella holothuriorum]
MSSSSAVNDLLKGQLGPTLKNMTMPVIVGMITMMTFNLVDTFFISMLGTQPLAAVSFTFPVTFAVISLSIGLSIGTSAVIARIIGQGSLTQARNFATASLYLSAVLVTFIAITIFLFSRPIFFSMGASESSYMLLMDYMNVWLSGCVLLILPMICNAIFRANGETKLPSYGMAGAGVLNAILDPVLIFGFGPVPALGIQGAALASVISWSAACLLILYVLGAKQKRIYYWPHDWPATFDGIKQIAAIGLPAAGANMLTPLAMGVLTAIAACYGEPVVAALGVGSRIESIACIVVLALSMTLPPLVSQNFGARQIVRAHDAYRLTAKFVLIWQAGIAVLLAITSPWLANLFSNDPEVQAVLTWYIVIMPIGYGLQGVVILTNSSFNALHKPNNAVMLSLLRFFVFFLPLAYLGGFMWGVNGLFIGAVAGNVLTAIVAWRWLNKLFKRFECMQQQEEMAV